MPNDGEDNTEVPTTLDPQITEGPTRCSNDIITDKGTADKTQDATPSRLEDDVPCTGTGNKTLMQESFGSDDESIVNSTPITRGLLSCQEKGKPDRDIGTTSCRIPPQGYTLDSDEQRVLEEMHESLGNQRVSKTGLAFSPPWIVEKTSVKKSETTGPKHTQR